VDRREEERAAMARALELAQSPGVPLGPNPRVGTVLLLDEPFTALDAASADRLRDLLRARLAEGLGLVIVTHNLAEVWDVATRVAVLVGGRWAGQEPVAGPLTAFLPRYREWTGG
jgi:ABC-type sulfate/molybdate transport systems ATPase subunit